MPEAATFTIHLCKNGKEFQVLPNVVDRVGVPRPGAGEIMDTGAGKWKIIGVRKESTATDYFVDVDGVSE